MFSWDKGGAVIRAVFIYTCLLLHGMFAKSSMPGKTRSGNTAERRAGEKTAFGLRPFPISVNSACAVSAFPVFAALSLSFPQDSVFAIVQNAGSSPCGV